MTVNISDTHFQSEFIKETKMMPEQYDLYLVDDGGFIVTSSLQHETRAMVGDQVRFFALTL